MSSFGSETVNRVVGDFPMCRDSTRQDVWREVIPMKHNSYEVLRGPRPGWCPHALWVAHGSDALEQRRGDRPGTRATIPPDGSPAGPRHGATDRLVLV